MLRILSQSFIRLHTDALKSGIKITNQAYPNSMKQSFTILFFLIITLLAGTAFAQDGDIKTYTKSYLSVFGGASFPQSDFGSSSYSNNKAGFAKRGFTAGLDGAYYFYKNLGVGITLSFQDQGELTSTDAQNLANGYNADFTKDQTDVTASNRYHYATLMAGPQYSIIYKKFTLDLRVDAGIIKSFSTPVTTVVFDNSETETPELTQRTSTARAFGYGGSAGLRWSFADNWMLGLRGNYITSTGIEIVNTGHTTTVGRLDNKQPIQAVQTTLGITVLF